METWTSDFSRGRESNYRITSLKNYCRPHYYNRAIRRDIFQMNYIEDREPLRLMEIFKSDWYLRLNVHLISTSSRSVLLFFRNPRLVFLLRLSHTLYSLIALPPSAFSFFPVIFGSSSLRFHSSSVLWKNTSRWRQQILFHLRADANIIRVAEPND